MVRPRKTISLAISLVATALFSFTIASSDDQKRQAPDPAVLSAPYISPSTTSSFNWWPYPPAGVDSSSTSSALDPYWTPWVTATSTSAPTFSVVTSSSVPLSDDDFLSTDTSTSTTTTPSTSLSIITLSALPPITTTSTTSTPHATTSHANHPLLPASPASSSQSARKDKVQAIVLGSLLGCALGAVIGWVGVGVWRSRRNTKGSRGTRAAKRNVKGIRYEDVQARDFPEREKDGHGRFGDDTEEEEVDAFIGQSRPFDKEKELVFHQDQTLLADEDGEDKDTLTRSWLARTFTAHRREGASLSRAFSPANVISVSANGGDGGGFLEAPQLSREPTRTAFSFSHPTPMPAPSKRPTMTPAPTIFSSTASSYDYEFDGDEEVYDSARLFTGEEDDNGAKGMGRKRGLLEKLKRWTGAYSYPVERSVGDEDGVVRGRGRTPELEAGVLYSESPSHSLQHSDSYKSITHEQETSSSLARNNTTNTTTTSTKTSSVISTRSSRRYPNLRRSQTRGYGHGRADSDVTIQLPPPSFSLPTNDADRNQDMYTALPSRVSRSRSRSASPVKRTLPTLPIAAPSQPVVPTEETSTIPRLVGGRPHPGPLPRVDSTILPLSPPLLSSPPLEQSLMFTSMLSLGGGQDTGANTGMGGMRRGVALVDPPIRHGFGLRLQDVGPMMDSPSSPGEAESEKRVAVSQGFDDSEARSNAGRVIGNKGTGTGTGKNVNGPRILKSTRRRGGGGATSMSMRDQTIPTPPAAPQPAPSVSMPTPRAVGRVLTRNSERSGGWIW